MATKLDTFNKTQLKKGIPDIHPGDVVRVYQKIKEKGKERVQPFEGMVIARKHGKGVSATIIVRKLVGGIGVEKIYPLHSPTIDKIEILKRAKVRRSKLYWLRTARGKRARLKQKKFYRIIPEEEKKEIPATEEIPTGEKDKTKQTEQATENRVEEKKD